MKRLIILLILFVSICAHAYTGNYCENKNNCIQINPNGKAQLIINGVSITGTYAKTDNNFLVIAKEPANQANKNLIVEQKKKEENATIDRAIKMGCDNATKSGKRYNGKIYGYTSHEFALCEKDSEQEQEVKKLRQEIRGLKYSDELLKEFVNNWWFTSDAKRNFALIGNSLHWASACESSEKIEAYESVRVFIKQGSAFDKNSLFCANGAIYIKCDGKAYEPESQKCENNIVLSECGNSWHSTETHFCSGNILKDYGKFTDSRDGKKYRTVAIGKQIWMGDNLDYHGEDGKLGYYKSNLKNSAKYGRLYSWKEAMKACPAGWHLPSDREWKILVNFAGGVKTAGKKLKSKSGWNNDGGGTDDYGFSALPGGDPTVLSLGSFGKWWSSSETGYTHRSIWYLFVGKGSDEAKIPYDYESGSYSVRCIQDGSGDIAETSAFKIFKDPRDGKEYKSVKIGDQTWMAENLNYKAKGSECYDSKPENCEKYGRLYDWNMAKSACPKEWHLPSDTEWQILVDFAGGEKVAGGELKARSGWDEGGNGTDDYGFSALPGGIGPPKGGFDFVGTSSFFWSATENDGRTAYGRSIKRNGTNVNSTSNFLKSALFSVRCIQD
jgi:uncharacterized protein (TIGR02145 family)